MPKRLVPGFYQSLFTIGVCGVLNASSRWLIYRLSCILITLALCNNGVAPSLRLPCRIAIEVQTRSSALNQGRRRWRFSGNSRH
jgi:hypothetical protein